MPVVRRQRERDSTTRAATRGRTSPIRSGSTSVRLGAVIASTGGAELVVWGGHAQAGFSSRDGRATANGARLGGDGAWRAIATAGAPSQRAGAAFAWTGRELVVWGGFKDGKPARGGAAWDPAADAWRRLPARATHASRRTSVWTGRELWLWDDVAGARAGHAYDPAGDRWRGLAALPEGNLATSAIAMSGDDAIVVARQGIVGQNAYGCVVWRYDARADAWAKGAPPPPVDTWRLTVTDAGGRVVLAIEDRVLEYAAATDAWAELPAHRAGTGVHVVWVAPEVGTDDARGARSSRRAGELVVLGRDATRSLALGAAGAAAAAARPLPKTELPAELAAPGPRPVFERGPAVTALAAAGDVVLAGHLDGSVRRLGGGALRKPDWLRASGLAIHDGAWTCLVGDGLEVRTLTRSAPAKRVALGFTGHALAHRGDRLVVAGDGKLAAFAWAKGTWRLERDVAVTGATTHLVLAGDTIARTVLAPAKAKGSRKDPRDTVELRDAATLKVREDIVPPHGRTSVAAVPIDGGAYIGGFGDHVKRYAHGKKRPVGEVGEYLTSLAISDDGAWLAGAGSNDMRVFGVGASDARAEVSWKLFDAEEYVALHDLSVAPAYPITSTTDEAARAVTAFALAPDGATVVAGSAGGAAIAIDRATLGVTAYPAAGEPVVLQPPSSEVIGRDGHAAGANADGVRAAAPDGRENLGRWRRWRVDGRFVDLGEDSDAAELLVLPTGALVARRRNELVVWSPDGATRACYGGAGDDVTGMTVPDRDHVIAWDRQGIVRRWRIQFVAAPISAGIAIATITIRYATLGRHSARPIDGRSGSPARAITTRPRATGAADARNG